MRIIIPLLLGITKLSFCSHHPMQSTFRSTAAHTSSQEAYRKGLIGKLITHSLPCYNQSPYDQSPVEKATALAQLMDWRQPWHRDSDPLNVYLKKQFLGCFYLNTTHITPDLSKYDSCIALWACSTQWACIFCCRPTITLGALTALQKAACIGFLGGFASGFICAATVASCARCRDGDNGHTAFQVINYLSHNADWSRRISAAEQPMPMHMDDRDHTD